jgi:hypothetical protein
MRMRRVRVRLGSSWALGIDLAADEAWNLLPDAVNIEGQCRSVRILFGRCGQRRSLRVRLFAPTAVHRWLRAASVAWPAGKCPPLTTTPMCTPHGL